MPASANFEKLKAKLRELFELDKADLDFGIYRILRQRHVEITEFLDRHLEETVRGALESHQTGQRSQLEAELKKAEAAAHAAGISPDQSPRVAELAAKLKGSSGIDDLADEVYSHVYTFFSRYYQDGDFMGLQRSTVRGREKYMIPYNGEEVKMIWANMDQYYIKSSELLRDYRFEIRPQVGPLFAGNAEATYFVEFRLVDADTEKDNRKPAGKITRAFQLDPEKPFVASEPTGLRINFRYVEQSSERSLQEKLNSDAIKVLSDDLPVQWKALLFAVETGKGKDAQRYIDKHLRAYTARQQFDYFIHKDLGGFLQRELDFYLKNEIMHIDDVEDTNADQTEEYLSKLRAIRRCARPVIRMLTQLEEFQKRLWLKKKFVVETRYCVTVDRVPRQLYAEICQNDAQWSEWEDLYALSSLSSITSPTARTVDFLALQPHLMIDTAHFSDGFVQSLVASFSEVDASINGLCIAADNFQALSFMTARYDQQIDFTYIDPPYNAAATEILYKNNFKHSSWLTLMADRLEYNRRLSRPSGTVCVTIDDYEFANLDRLLEQVFGSEHHLATVPIRNNPSGRATVKGFAINHEYALFYARDSSLTNLGRLPHTQGQRARYDESSDGRAFEWENFRKNSSASDRAERPKQFYPIACNLAKGTMRIPKMSWDLGSASWNVSETEGQDERFVFPRAGGVDKVWRYGLERARLEIADLRFELKNGGIEIYKKKFLNSEGSLPRTWWDSPSYSARDNGSRALSNLFGEAASFDFPKSPFAVADSIRIGCPEDDGTVLDYFAGSGTTAAAVLLLNQEEDRNLKYILVEQGQHFNDVIIPRLKKLAYASEWRNGSPASPRSGQSHVVKVIRLESYEDTLNNLVVNRDTKLSQALRGTPETERNEYLLGYFLGVETEGSPSLLDTSLFRNPFSYQLQIATRTVGETKSTAVDMVETFNWLIGLKVKHIDHQKGFVTVTGERRSGERTLIVWRSLSDDPVGDGENLRKYLDRINVNPADTEFEFIYINGSHTLEDPHKKIHLIEEEFHLRMFESDSFESLS